MEINYYEGLFGYNWVLPKRYFQLEEGYIVVNKQYKEGGEIVNEEDEQETIKIMKFNTYPAHVSIGLSKTIPTGNYASVKVSVNITVPCYVEQINEAEEFVYKTAVEKLVSRTKPIEEKYKNRS